MNKFLSTALGLAAVGSIGAADPGDGDWKGGSIGAADPGDGDWKGLDSEINGLASSLAPQGDGQGWTALLRTRYGYSSDDISTGGGADLSGFDLADVDLAFWGSSGDFRFRVSGDLDSGSNISVEDAYAEWACGGYVTTRIGHLKARVLRSAFIDPENTLFIDRTVLGSTMDMWDMGAMAYGENSGLNWAFTLQNGSTSQFADHFYSLRLSYDIGAGAGSYEGARGGNDELNATLGASVTSHSGAAAGPSDNMSYYVDFNGNFSQFGFGAEFAQLDDDDGGATTQSDWGQLLAPTIMTDGDSSPFAVTFSFLLNPEFELGARFEDLDNANSTEVTTFGVSYYRNGNNAKWQAQYTDVSDDVVEGSYWQIGLTVGGSR